MQKEKLLKREMTMVEFIDVYCSELSGMLSMESKQDKIEINYTSTEFNALTEVKVALAYNADYQSIFRYRCWE